MTQPAVLLTGGTGFVGSAIARALLAQGTPFSGLFRGDAPVAMGPAIREGRVRAVFGDLATPPAGRWPIVIHSAGQILKGARPDLDPLGPAAKCNVEESLAFLDVACQEGGHLVLLSTADVYGHRPDRLPVDEGHPLRPATYYASSKAAQEMLAAVLASRRRLTLTVLRFAQVYGPGDNSEKVIPLFARKIAGGDAPILRAGGAARRNWVYIDDAALAVLAAVRGRVAGTFNITGPEASTVREMAELLCRLDGRGIQPILDPEGAVDDLVHDGTLAARMLGFRPSVSLGEGLARYWSWLRDAEQAGPGSVEPPEGRGRER
jgi:nucleoside-diphosphate-sugar epimerase